MAQLLQFVKLVPSQLAKATVRPSQRPWAAVDLHTIKSLLAETIVPPLATIEPRVRSLWEHVICPSLDHRKILFPSPPFALGGPRPYTINVQLYDGFPNRLTLVDLPSTLATLQTISENTNPTTYSCATSQEDWLFAKHAEALVGLAATIILACKATGHGAPNTISVSWSAGSYSLYNEPSAGDPRLTGKHIAELGMQRAVFGSTIAPGLPSDKAAAILARQMDFEGANPHVNIEALFPPLAYYDGVMLRGRQFVHCAEIYGFMLLGGAIDAGQDIHIFTVDTTALCRPSPDGTP